jgi:hypothetical protein
MRLKNHAKEGGECLPISQGKINKKDEKGTLQQRGRR